MLIPVWHIGHLICTGVMMGYTGPNRSRNVAIGLCVIAFIFALIIRAGLGVRRGKRIGLAMICIAGILLPGWLAWLGFVVTRDRSYPFVLYVYEGFYLLAMLTTLALLTVLREKIRDAARLAR